MIHIQKAVTVFLITALIGPLVGGLLVAGPLGLGMLVTSAHPFEDFARVMMLVVVKVSYSIGMLSSLLAGVILGWRVLQCGAVSIPFVLAIAAVSGPGGLFLGQLRLLQLLVEPEGRNLTAVLVLVMALMSLLSAVLLLPLLSRTGILKRAVNTET